METKIPAQLEKRASSLPISRAKVSFFCGSLSVPDLLSGARRNNVASIFRHFFLAKNKVTESREDEAGFFLAQAGKMMPFGTSIRGSFLRKDFRFVTRCLPGRFSAVLLRKKVNPDRYSVQVQLLARTQTKLEEN